MNPSRLLVFATVVWFGCSSDRSASNHEQLGGHASRASCFRTVRIHDVAGARGGNGQPIPGFPTNFTGVDIRKLDDRDRVLIKETDYGTTPQGFNGVVGSRAYVWDGGPRTLRMPEGFDEIEASWMNDRSEVVGSARLKGTESHRPFIWSAEGAPTALPFDGHPVAINNLGHIAFIVSTGVRFANPKLFLYRDGEAIALGAGSLTDMNDADEMVGTAGTNHYAMYWRVGEELVLGSAGVRLAAPHINASGAVAFSAGTPDALEHPFTWRAGVARDLGTLGGNYAYAQAINDRGDVIGGSAIDADHAGAFIWSEGKMRSLAPPGAFIAPQDLNERRQVVGATTTSAGDRPFLWEDGALNVLTIDASLYPESCRSAPTAAGCPVEGRKINERGTIAGVVSSPQDGAVVPFLLLDECANPPSPPPDAGPEPEPQPEEPTE